MLPLVVAIVHIMLTARFHLRDHETSSNSPEDTSLRSRTLSSGGDKQVHVQIAKPDRNQVQAGYSTQMVKAREQHRSAPICKHMSTLTRGTHEQVSQRT